LWRRVEKVLAQHMEVIEGIDPGTGVPCSCGGIEIGNDGYDTHWALAFDHGSCELACDEHLSKVCTHRHLHIAGKLDLSDVFFV
jgi:hypothetical protein